MISPLVERVGLTLERRLDEDIEKFYLVGDAEFEKGQKFDAAQLKRANNRGGRPGFRSEAQPLKKSGFEHPFQARQSRLGMAS
jgi:hypothetical protein